MGTDNKKKIYCISVMQNWGGGEEFLLNLCENLDDFKFVIVTPEGEAEKRFRAAGIHTLINDSQKKVYRDSGWGLLSVLSIAYRLFLSTFRLPFILIKENPGLILANGLFAALYVLPTSVLTHQKFILIQHLIFNEGSIEKKILKLVYRFTEKIVCVSAAVKDNIAELGIEDVHQKIAVIPNGIQISDKPEINDLMDDVVRIGVVGSLIRIKGLHLILDAAKTFLSSGKAVLKIFGTTTQEEDSVRYKAELVNRIIDACIGEYVSFEGHVSSREQIYSNIDILINFSTISESFSFTVLEAMAHGKIVIAANRGGPKELVEDGISGFLVEAGNAAELRNKLAYCVENIKSESLVRIRGKARERVEDHFSIEKFSSNYRNLFHSILDKV